MAIFAYLRVSTTTHDQTTENQRKLIVDAGFNVDEFICEEGVSGSVVAMSRPAFSYMIFKAKEGDTCIVTMVDRLGRCAEDVLHTINQFRKLGIKLRIMQFDGIDVTSTTGKLIVSVMASFAEMEKNLLIERTVAGLARTKSQGTKLGAPLTIKPEVLEEMCSLKCQGKTLDVLSAKFSIPRMTISRNIKKWGKNIEGYRAEFKAKASQYEVKKAAMLQAAL